MIESLKGIRKSVDARLRSLPLVKETLDGKTDKSAYCRYLSLVANRYAEHSPKVMALAASRCINSHPELGKYLMQHACEECGHNDWAKEDLLKQEMSLAQIDDARGVPACDAMIGYEYYLAAFANPVAIFGWMYILEAVGADLGPDAYESLTKQNVPAQFVGGHSVADVQHTQEIEDTIANYVVEESDQADVLHAAKVSADLYVRMFEQAQSAE